jgi:FMN-dependent NADH-azoreductase
MKLLHVDASILGQGSVSRQVSAAIVDSLAKAGPGLEIVRRDLAADPRPHLDTANIPAAHPLSAMAPGENPARAASDAALEEFLAADIVVIGAPMYNFAVPSQLKAWIDRIVVAGKTFAYRDGAAVGLAGDKRVILALARGNLYGAGSPAAGAEHAESWLRTIFGFIGIVPEVVLAEGVQRGPDARAAAIDSALKGVTALAA